MRSFEVVTKHEEVSPSDLLLTYKLSRVLTTQGCELLPVDLLDSWVCWEHSET